MQDQLTQDEMAAVLKMSKRSYLREEAKLLATLRQRFAARGVTAQDLEELLEAIKGGGGESV